MFGLAAGSNDVIFFPVEILNACELAGQGQMLLEMVEIVFEGLGNDLRDIRGPEYVGNALILFAQFRHSVTSLIEVVRIRRGDRWLTRKTNSEGWVPTRAGGGSV